MTAEYSIPAPQPDPAGQEQAGQEPPPDTPLPYHLPIPPWDQP
ncbi:hypothetical protein ABZ897_15905 [Nonomuraea sp. NPDC046802]